MVLDRWQVARARAAMNAGLRDFFSSAGFQEVETPVLVPSPGLEPHIEPFEVAFHSPAPARSRPLYLHTSPEYAMKRLLADGSGSIFQLCKAFRDGELAATHNPEFTLLEFYRVGADYEAIMTDLEGALAVAQEAVHSSVGGKAPGPFLRRPYEVLTVTQAFMRHTAIDLRCCTTAQELSAAARALGVRSDERDAFEDLFFRVFLERIEPHLGQDRPVFLTEYPASMAALARLKRADSSVAERCELYVRGLELANGFSELTDSVEQRRRLVEEQRLRRSLGRPAHALDERFLEAVGKMPDCAGIAVGLDRVLMLLLGAASINDVLLFPAREFLA